MYKGVYGGIVEDLLQFGRFTSIRMGVMRMSIDQRIDIYKGVYKVYINPDKPRKDDGTKHLFETLYDWFRIDFSVKYVETMMKDPYFMKIYGDRL